MLVIFNKDDISDNFYILKNGLVKIEVIVDIENENIWPVVL